MRTSDYEGAGVYSPKGERLGTVEYVLFHPSEPRAVALMVRRPAWLYVVSLPSAFIPLSSVRLTKAGARFDAEKLPKKRAAIAAIGHHPDVMVIWRGMPVRSKTGSLVGSVGDVELDPAGGVASLLVTGGGMSDLTFGRRSVPGSVVEGFDGYVVRVTANPDEFENSGGIARKAGAGVVTVKATATKAAAATGAAVVGAGYVAGKAIGAAAASETGQKARSVWSGLADAFRAGLRGEGDDE